MRIAYLTDIITPYLVVLLEALAREAGLTALFCSHSGTRGMQWSVELAFQNEVINGLTIRRRTLDGTDYYLSPRIIAALRRARPDVVVSSGFSVPSLYAALYCRAQRIPLLIQSDGSSDSEARLGFEQRGSRQVLRRLAWGAVASSAPAARRFVEIGFPASRVFRAPHVVRMEPFWEAALNRPDNSGGPLRLLYVGRLIPRKGCDWLLRAVAAAMGNGAQVELTVAGSGPDESSLKALAAELGVPVTWRGFVDQPELPGLYAQADAFVFPTLDDPFGIVLIEAAAAGLPIVASPYGGATEELVAEGVSGFVVDPTDTAAMAVAVTRLAQEPALRKRMATASYALTLARTPAASARGYLDAARTALADRTV